MNKASPLGLKIKEAIHSQSSFGKTSENSCINEIKELQQAEDVSKQQAGERKLHIRLLYRFIYLWCIAVAILLFGCGAGEICLSDIVLTTVLACTTLTVFGFFYFVIRYFFDNKSA